MVETARDAVLVLLIILLGALAASILLYFIVAVARATLDAIRGKQKRPTRTRNIMKTEDKK